MAVKKGKSLKTVVKKVDIDLKKLKFDDKGLIPAIIQDYKDKEVLMIAYMNLESLRKTIKLGKTCYWSRSRQEYWVKGETSGHFQYVKSIAYDCDQDALLIKVRQIGPACHTENRSCFFRKIL
jgi:phosphoribosyl-AMP cyclohydrolase